MLLVEQRPGNNYWFHEISVSKLTFGNQVQVWSMNPINRKPIQLMALELDYIQCVVYVQETVNNQFSITQINDNTKFADFPLALFDASYTKQQIFFGKISTLNKQVVLLQTSDFRVHVKFCEILGTGFPDCQDPGKPSLCVSLCVTICVFIYVSLHIYIYIYLSLCRWSSPAAAAFGPGVLLRPGASPLDGRSPRDAFARAALSSAREWTSCW